MATKHGGIDKEQMFKKIMPSAGSNAAIDAPSGKEKEPSVLAPQAPASAAQTQTTAPPSIPAQSPEASQPEATLSAALKDLAAKAAAQPPSLAENTPPHPVNLAEMLVEKNYPIYRTRLDGCECQRCRDDVCGMTLNKIKPRYVSSNLFSEADLANRQLVTETITALIRSIFLVKLSPHHGSANSIRT